MKTVQKREMTIECALYVRVEKCNERKLHRKCSQLSCKLLGEYE
jgi:hypothetical protein